MWSLTNISICISHVASVTNPYCAEFIERNIKIYLYFLLVLNAEMLHIIDNRPRGKQ